MECLCLMQKTAYRIIMEMYGIGMLCIMKVFQAIHGSDTPVSPNVPDEQIVKDLQVMNPINLLKFQRIRLLARLAVLAKAGKAIATISAVTQAFGSNFPWLKQIWKDL